MSSGSWINLYPYSCRTAQVSEVLNPVVLSQFIGVALSWQGPPDDDTAEPPVGGPQVSKPEEASKPEPEVWKPQVTMPHVSNPAVVSKPKVSKPEEVSKPKVSTPDLSKPKVSTPVLSTPEVSKPKVSKPEVSKPKVSKPEVSKPKVSTPMLGTPAVSKPEVSKPRVSTPELSKPKVSVPEVRKVSKPTERIPPQVNGDAPAGGGISGGSRPEVREASRVSVGGIFTNPMRPAGAPSPESWGETKSALSFLGNVIHVVARTFMKIIV